MLINWLKQLRESFLAWTRANAEANAKVAPHSCCSAPPPGAGSRDPRHGR